jgi:diguanylate cyclase (GGDEF)-like protein/PAS domain S-box-containing protein
MEWNIQPMSKPLDLFPAHLKHKLALRVTLGAILFALISVAVNTWFVFDRQHSAAKTLQSHLAATVKSSAAVAAFARNEEIARDVVAGLLTNPLVAAAAITTESGLIVFNSRRTSALHTEPDAIVLYPLPSPIMGDEVVGQLTIELDTAYVDANALESAIRQSLTLMAQLVISAILLIVLFDIVVGRSLSRLAHQTRSTMPGTGVRLDTPKGHQDDEIGSLVDSGNSLLATVDRTLQEERELRAKVEKMEEHYRRIFETTNVGIMVLNQQGQLINSNPALLERIVGIRFDGLKQAEDLAFIEAIFVAPSAVWDLIALASQSHHSVSGDCQLRTSDGTVRWAHCIFSVVVGQKNQIELIEGVLYDVTQRKLEEDNNRTQADHDTLTGLHNRRGMETFLDRSLRHAAEVNQELAVLLIDLDGFKAVNDTHGHEAGDQVLKGVAHRMQERIRRGSDLVARQGGDEFVVILTNSGPEARAVEAIACDLVTLLREPFPLDDGSFAQIGASIGIARFPEHGSTRKEIVAAADAAMYGAKKSGKNRYAVAEVSALPNKAFEG